MFAQILRLLALQTRDSTSAGLQGRSVQIPPSSTLAPIACRDYFGVKLNFCPPTEASYIRPPLM